MSDDAVPFTRSSLTFLRGLRRHNERPWFEEHRADYEGRIRAPLVSLVEEMDVRLAAFAPEMVGNPRRSPFRIHRDIRFSNDKSPYKTHAAAWFYHCDAGHGVGTATAHGGAGFYFHLEPGASQMGGGIWMPPRPTLNAIRTAIDESPRALSTILSKSAIRDEFGELADEARLSRMPRGYPDTHPAASLLKYQSFTVGRELSDAEVIGSGLIDTLVGAFERILPLVRWINTALGLRTLARR